MGRASTWFGLAFLALGLAMPPRGLAALLLEPNAARFESVVLGAWILKGAWLALGALLFALSRTAATAEGGEPLLARGVREPPPTSLRAGVALGLVLCTAVALRWNALDAQLWFDEIDTLVHYGRAPLGDVLTTLDSQNQHLLYSALARTSIAVFAESNAALRAPAALFGVASLWALWNFARRVAQEREALWATALLAVSYQHVWFSQNARGYTGLLFFTLLGSGLFLDLVSRRGPSGLGRPLAYGLCMAGAVAVHVTALFAVAAHGLIWLGLLASARARPVGALRWRAGLGFAFTALFAVACYALVLPQFVDTMFAKTLAGQATEWKNPLWLATATLRGIAQGLPGGWMPVALGAAVAALGLWSYARQSTWILTLFLGGPLVTAAAILALHHNLWPRFFFFAAGFFVLIALRGLFTAVELVLRGRWATWQRPASVVACAVMVSVAALGLRFVYQPKQDFLGALEFVRGSAGAGDAVATVEMTHLPYGELYQTGWAKVASVAELEALERSHPATWVVYCTPEHLRTVQPELWTRLQNGYVEAKSFPGTVGGSEVVVRVRR